MSWSHTFVCQAELLRSGWSLGMIDALLGGVDKHASNPCCRSWAPMRLWLRARVAEVERSDARQAYQAIRRQRAKETGASIESDDDQRDAYARAKWGC